MKFSEVLQEYLEIRESEADKEGFRSLELYRKRSERKKRLLEIMDKMIPETIHFPIKAQVTLVSKCK